MTRIQQAKHVLLIPHQNPDGDALGSVTAMMHLLRSMDIPHVAYCATDYAPRHSYLPHIDQLTTDEAVWEEHDFDLMIVMDSGDLRYAGVDHLLDKLKKKPFIINIDHHPTNELFGDLNLVITKAASTTEIIYNLFKVGGVTIDKYMATCLLTGVITDTGNFTNAATTAHAMKISSELIARGGNINLIKELMFKDKTVDVLKLWGAVLARLAKHDDHEIVYTYVTQDDLKKHHVGEDDTDGISNFMNNLADGKAALVLRELEDGTTKGSFRTTRDDVDVSAYAAGLGGGGHKKAAGFSVNKGIDETLKEVWEVVERIQS